MTSSLEQICVSTWSFHTLFEADKPMDARDFPEMVADRYHVHNVEMVYPHFASIEPAYVNEFNDRLRKAHPQLVNIPIDYKELWEKPSLSSPNRQEREHAIGLYQKGIDLAAAVGAPAGAMRSGTGQPRRYSVAHDRVVSKSWRLTDRRKECVS